MIKQLYKSPMLRRFFASIWSTLVSSAVIFAGGALITIGLRDLSNPGKKAIVVGIVILVLGWFLAHIAKKFENEEKDSSKRDLESAGRKAVAAFNGRLGHVYTLLLKVVDPVTRQANLEAYIQTALGSSVSLFDVDRARACLYILDGSVTKADSDKPSLLVHRPPHCGRADSPRRDFRRDTDHGDLLFDVLATRRPLHIPDTSSTEKRIDAEAKIYNSFVAVPIYSGNDELGVLTLDAVVAGSLTDDHVVTAQTLASMLAIGLHLAAPLERIVPSRTRTTESVRMGPNPAIASGATVAFVQGNEGSNNNG
ncbi:transcriptional regulator with GAF, ATPase, and Fis domain [Arthrobacter sp. UYCu512]|uniref:GAF domain-containing protein n=1 Tax=Arthrobacter sp. UYCu512 TaxID=3156338 RepID=UPI00339928A2